MTDGYVYEPELDRFDVAVRAAVALALGGRKDWARQVGLTREEHFKPVNDALLDINLHTEDGVLEMIRRCPFILEAALELLLLYNTRYAITRGYHYARARL